MSITPHPPLNNSSNWPMEIAGFPAGWNLASAGGRAGGPGLASETWESALRGDQEMKTIIAVTLLFIANAVLALIDRRGRRSLEKRLMESDEEDP